MGERGPADTQHMCGTPETDRLALPLAIFVGCVFLFVLGAPPWLCGVATTVVMLSVQFVRVAQDMRTPRNDPGLNSDRRGGHEHA